MKATKALATRFIKPYLSKDENGDYITAENAKKAIQAILLQYENCYAGYEVNDEGRKVFVAKTPTARAVYFSIPVK